MDPTDGLSSAEADSSRSTVTPDPRVGAVGVGATPRGNEELAFKILGPIEVMRANGDRIVLSPELRAVLGILILRPRQVVPVEDFIDALWPTVEDRVARRRLHTAMWKLRKLLNPGGVGHSRSLIKWSSPGYVLEVADRQLDWVRFRRLRLAGEEELRLGEPRLAKTYLSAALTFWVGTEALLNVEVPVRDLGFVAERNAGRERAAQALVEACFRIGEHDRVIPELEARIAVEPFDDEAVTHLAIAYYRSGNPQRALAICRHYLDLWANDDSARPAPLVTELHTSILRRDVDIGGPALGRSTPKPEPVLGQGAFMSASWPGFPPSRTDPVPAELVLLIAERGGHVFDSTDSSVEASFADAAAAIDAALALHRCLGIPSPARVGIEIPRSKRIDEAFDGPVRARARLLAIAAREGQVLVSTNDERFVVGHESPGARLISLGRHRLNALSHPTPVFRLEAPGLSSNEEAPLWFDRGSPASTEDGFRLVGRDREIAEISSRLGRARLVTLVGAPGSGKTKLAGHVSGGLSGEYRDGVWHVALHPLSQPGMVAPTIAEVLRLPRPAALHRDALFRALRDREALLVLDNCEHLLEECRELVDGLLGQCPEISVLATSRESLGSRFENVLTVHPLERPPMGPPDMVLGNAAVMLLHDRLAVDEAAPLKQDSLSRVNIEAIARICRAVDGIPLALVLAAARAEELGVDRLADALEETLGEGQGLTVLSAPAGNGALPTSLGATMEWSYELLDESERELFECLAVFRASFGPEDVVAVCGGSGLCGQENIEAGLQRLIRVSLVIKEGNSGRFRLLQPIRDFASHMLLARPGRALEVRRCHAHHFMSLAEEAEPYLRGPQDRDVLDRLDRSLPDLYAAIRWAIEHRESGSALRLVGSMWVLWLVRGRIVEGWHMLEAALDLEPLPTEGRVKALAGCARLAWFGGNLNRTLECNREILAIAEMTGDAWAWALSALGFAAVEMFGSEDDAVPLRIEEVLPQFRALGNDWETGMALQTLTGAAWHRGKYERAEKAAAQTAGIFRSLGHPTLMSSQRIHGLMLALLGDIEAGISEVDRSMANSYEASDLAGLAESLCCRGAIGRYGGNHDLSRHYYRDALRAARDAGQVWMIQWALGGLGNTDQLGLNVPTERLDACVQLIARAEELGDETGITMAPRELDFRRRDLARARAHLGEDAFEEAVGQGRRLDLPEAIELALSLESHPATIG